ncbi:uncharacterized protein [Anoplolepis gracilipes]|uniref:uncharacterized protein n=1 Tax=Anoplolepis gracilipes TaxID=354296 RepID=UPI003BA01208
MAESKKMEQSKMAKLRLHLSQHKTNRCVSILIKPLRIFQFFAVLLLFAFMIYMIAMDPTPISTLACILLIVLSGVYVFVLAVELISHFAGNAVHIIPMCVFSLIGLIFFGVAGILLILYDYTQLVVQVTVIIFCLLTALFFLLDVTMVFVFWKRKCAMCKQGCYYEGAEYLPREEPRPRDAKVSARRKKMKRDITTSLSDVRIPVELKSVVPDHCFRKIEYPRRREYVDSPTCVPSLCTLSIAQIQTDPCKTSVVESQTPSTVVKETPMQTFTKCDFCHQLLQTAVSPDSQDAAGWSYPAIVQFIRGGVNMPCCPGCKCITGTAPQTQQQQRPQQRSRPSPSKYTESPVQAAPKPETSKRLTSEATQQVTSKFDIRNCVKLLTVQDQKPDFFFFFFFFIVTKASKSGTVDGTTKLTTGIAQTVTRLTLASFYVKPDKKTQASPDNPVNSAKRKDITEAKKDGTSQESKSIITMITKGEEPVVKELIESVDRKKRSKSSDKERKEEPAKEVECPGKIERSKGGGEEEHQITAYHQFMRASEEESMFSLQGSQRHTVGTQMNLENYFRFRSATLISPFASGRSKSRTFLHLKSNKVDVIRDADASDSENPVAETVASRTFVSSAVQKDERAESPNPIEHRMNDVCSHCKRQSFTSNCCNVFKDKRGRYFCEFCVPTDSKKITSRLDVTDLKKLRCANCRLSLRAQGVKTVSTEMPISQRSSAKMKDDRKNKLSLFTEY